MKALNPILMSGREVIPVIEGGKGISITNGESSGAWAACGGVGTFSGVNADAFDRDGNLIPQIYRGRTRRERHEELVEYAISGALYQARVAHESSGSRRAHPYERPVGDGRRRTHPAGDPRERQGADPRRHLRRRDAVPAGRDRGPLRRALLPHHLLGTGVSRPVEARLPQVRRGDGRRGLRRPLARRRPQRGSPTTRIRKTPRIRSRGSSPCAG